MSRVDISKKDSELLSYYNYSEIAAVLKNKFNQEIHFEEENMEDIV